MLRSVLLILLLSLTACGNEPSDPQTSEVQTVTATDENQLTLERLYASPGLSGPSPRGVAFSPDGKRVTFLKSRADEANRWDLWQFDVATGKPSLLVDSKILEPKEVELSEEEKALRERKRIAGSKGIVSYQWGANDTVLIPIGGDLHMVWLGEDEFKISLLPKAAELGVTLADVSNVIRESLIGEEVQRLPKTGEQVQTLIHLSNTRVNPAFLEILEIETSKGQLIPISEIAKLEEYVPNHSSRQLTNTDAFEYDAKVSPQGNYVSFVRDGAVYAIDLETNEETRLTPEAEPENAIQYGVAEFVAQEEMSRYTGYWWSPDDRYIAYTRVDESTVDIIPRFDIAAEDVTVIEQRYPRAGRPNAIVDLFVRDRPTGAGGAVDWRRDDWGPATDQYLARVNWGKIKPPETKEILLFTGSVNREQTRLDYSLFRTIETEHRKKDDKFIYLSGRSKPIGDNQDTWINLSHDFKVIHSPSGILTTNEGSGYRQLELYLNSGEVMPFPSFGEWAVDALSGYVTGEEKVYFTGYADTPLERHLYSVSLDGVKPTRITELGKSWSITMSPDGQSFVGTSSSPDQPPQTGLYKADGTLITWIEENALDDTHPYAPYLQNHTVPEYGTLKAEDGSDLYYSIQTPPDFDPTKKYPVILYVYGGPGVQIVTRNWESLADQYYTRQGYIVWRLDNRGTPNRGKAFEDVIYRQMGIPEVRDQLVGVEHLKSLPYVDADRIAIQGWSYGGYMTLMTILQAPENTFAAAFAGAPVTDWALYDTFYTERYMDTPQDNPEGYEKSSVFYHLDKLKHELPPLMLVHGMADDNVTFDNTTRLMAELQKRSILFDVMTYPGERHGIRGEGLSTHLMKTRMAFLDRHLKTEE